MAVVLGYPGFWSRNPDTGVDWMQMLHGEQALMLHKPLPAEGEIIGRSRITGLVDRGAGQGRAAVFRARGDRCATGEKLATLDGTTFLRGDGGFGGPSGPVKQPHPEPERAPDITLDLRPGRSRRCVYRLNGDLNPLHIDPAVAAKAGFPRPILHGLCTFGMVCHALLRALCGYDTDALRADGLRFSSPGLPGRDDPHRDLARGRRRGLPRARGGARQGRGQQRAVPLRGWPRMSPAERAARFAALHESGCFALPNAWDAGSARVLAVSGAVALATTSAGIAWSLGRRDYACR